MTDSETSKAIKQLKRHSKSHLIAHGFIGLRGDRLSRPYDDFAHVVELFRNRQSNELIISFGIAIYNTDCQHLHFTLNGRGTTFTVVPMLADETMQEIRRHDNNVIIHALSRFMNKETLLGINSPISLLAKQSLDNRNEQYYEKNKRYWNGDIACAANDQQW